MVDQLEDVIDSYPLCTFKGDCPAKFVNAAGAVCTSETRDKPCSFIQMREDPLAVITQILNASAPPEKKPEGNALFTVAFDIDLTLIDAGFRPRYHVIALMKWFVDNGNTVHVWSGGGLDYCETWILKLGLDVWGVTALPSKFCIPVDIAVDDMADSINAANQKNAKVIIKV